SAVSPQPVGAGCSVAAPALRAAGTLHGGAQRATRCGRWDVRRWCRCRTGTGGPDANAAGLTRLTGLGPPVPECTKAPPLVPSEASAGALSLKPTSLPEALPHSVAPRVRRRDPP